MFFALQYGQPVHTNIYITCKVYPKEFSVSVMSQMHLVWSDSSAILSDQCVADALGVARPLDRDLYSFNDLSLGFFVAKSSNFSTKVSFSISEK